MVFKPKRSSSLAVLRDPSLFSEFYFKTLKIQPLSRLRTKLILIVYDNVGIIITVYKRKEEQNEKKKKKSDSKDVGRTKLQAAE